MERARVLVGAARVRCRGLTSGFAPGSNLTVGRVPDLGLAGFGESFRRAFFSLPSFITLAPRAQAGCIYT